MRSRKRIEDKLDSKNVQEASEREIGEYTRAEPASLKGIGTIGLRLTS